MRSYLQRYLHHYIAATMWKSLEILKFVHSEAKTRNYIRLLLRFFRSINEVITYFECCIATIPVTFASNANSFLIHPSQSS